METEIGTHRFSRLAAPPYSYIGFSVEKYQACQGAPIQPGASCDHCGTPIMNVYRFRGSDGRVFKLGCDCAERTDDEVGRKVRAIRSEQEGAKRRAKASERREREQSRRVAEFATVEAAISDPEISSKLSALPHPFYALAESGKTRLDWARYLLTSYHSAGPVAAFLKTIEVAHG